MTPDATRRLDSWKEIASFLGRRVRTVQRWEREEGLPVQRLRHRQGTTVYADPEALTAWFAARSLPAGGPRAEDDATGVGGSTRAPALDAPPVAAPGEGLAPAQREVSGHRPFGLRRAVLVGGAVAALLAVALLGLANAPRPARGPIRILVEPLAVLAADPELPQVAAGLTEDLRLEIAALAPDRIVVLHPRPGSPTPAADLVLGGTVRVEPEGLHVSAHLVDASDGAQRLAGSWRQPHGPTSTGRPARLPEQVAAAVGEQLATAGAIERETPAGGGPVQGGIDAEVVFSYR